MGTGTDVFEETLCTEPALIYLFISFTVLCVSEKVAAHGGRATQRTRKKKKKRIIFSAPKTASEIPAPEGGPSHLGGKASSFIDSTLDFTCRPLKASNILDLSFRDYLLTTRTVLTLILRERCSRSAPSPPLVFRSQTVDEQTSIQLFLHFLAPSLCYKSQVHNGTWW